MEKMLPPILLAIFLIVMCLICWGSGSPHIVIYPYTLIGLPFIATGLILAVRGRQFFKRLGTNIMTFDEPDLLVTEGLFRYTRNPMYLGFVVALLGFSLLVGAAVSSLLLVMLFILITDRWYIAFEEKVMLRKFGSDYDNYCQKVRRWI